MIGNKSGRTRQRKVRHEFGFWSIVIIVLLVLAAFFIVYPFAKLFYQSFFPKGGAFSLSNYAKFFSKKYYMMGLRNSMLICVCTTILGTLIGIPMAYISTRFNIWGKRIINMAVVLSMLSPPFIGAYSWILLLGRAGFITKLLEKIGIEIGSIYGFQGILLVFTLKLFPYVYMYVSTALKNFDSSLEEASESLGVHGFKRIWHVTLPVIMPTILSAALIVFMTSLADFGTPMLIGEGFKTLPVMIYERYLSEVSSNASFASTLSVVIVCCSLLVLAIQKIIIARKNYTMSAMRPPEVVKLSTGKRILATFAVGFVALLAVLPQITVVVTSFLKTNGPLFVKGFSLDSYRAILGKLSTNIRNTFTFSVIAIIIMMILGLLLAYIIVRRRGKIANLLDTLVMFPYVIPGSVLGISLILAFNQKPFILTGTVLILVVSYTIRKLPFTLRSSIATLYQIDPAIEEASISLGVPPMKTFAKTTAILMLPGMLSGAVLSFIATINELSSTIILYSGKTGTISVAIYTEIFKDGYGTAAALATILTVSTIIALIIFDKVSGGKSVVG
ncbi:MAG: iron ABC transporter permease [Eubacteriales bacterium]|nr:iron ABC transporter permease [Eubacteriales bacterium]